MQAFESISVVEPIPPLIITLPRMAEGHQSVIHVTGMPESTAVALGWADVAGKLIELGTKYLLGGSEGGGGGSGSGGGCITVSATNPDGSSFSYKWCPPPKA